jgi:hypothetical protein
MMGKTPYREGGLFFSYLDAPCQSSAPVGASRRAHHWAAGCSNSWRFAGGLPTLSDRRLGAGLVLALNASRRQRQLAGAGLLASEPVNDIVPIATDERSD